MLTAFEADTILLVAGGVLYYLLAVAVLWSMGLLTMPMGKR